MPPRDAAPSTAPARRAHPPSSARPAVRGARLRALPAPGGPRPVPRPRGCRRDPPRLTLLLAIVRRPGRVAQTARLLRTRELEERVERARMRIDVGVPIPEPRE